MNMDHLIHFERISALLSTRVGLDIPLTNLQTIFTND